MSIKSFPFLLIAASVLAACQTPPASEPSTPATPPPPAETHAPAPLPPAPTPSGPVSPEAKVQSQKVAMSAVELLQAGNEDQARSELRQALLLDPQNRLALNLTRQLSSDAMSLLGRDSFPYTVRSGESLSMLAQRFLGDPYSFYALARYNDIKVPRQLAAGQVLRIPGKAPPVGARAVEPPPPPPPPGPAPSPPTGAPPAPAPSPVVVAPPPPPPPTLGEVAMRNGAAAEKVGDRNKARNLYLEADRLGQPGAAAKAAQMKTELINGYNSAARAAQLSQNLDGAIGNYQKALDLDPDNAIAKLGIARARELKDKLGSVK